jgi:hypothetical protein
MADFFRGLSGGFQSGLQLGQAMRDKRQREELAQVFAKPETYSDYSPEDVKRIQGLATSGGYDVEAIPGAEGQVPTLRYTPKAGLDELDIRAPQPIEISPQQVQRYGGQVAAGQFDPMVLQGLRAREAARVVGAYGDPVRAAQLEADAIRMEREAKMAPLQEQLLKNQLEAGALGLKRTQQELDAGDRTALAAKRMEDFNTWRSQNPQADFAAMNNKAKELGMSVDEQFKLASNLTGINEQDFKASQQRIRKLVENKGLDGLLKAHKESNDLDPGSHFEATRGKNGVLSLNRVDTATGKVIQANVFSGTEAETTAYLNKAAMDPATIIDFTMTLEKNKAAIEASRSQTRASDSTVSLNAAKAAQTAAQTKILTMNVENNVEARKIQSDLASLDEENDPTGSRRANLIAQFNMLAAGPGKTIPMGGTGGKKGSVLQTPVELKKNDDGTYTAYSKDGGRALYNTYNGEELPLGMEVDAYKKMKEAAVKNGVGLVTGEENGRLVLKYIGADGKYYDDPQKAKYAKPAPNAAAPAQGLDTGTKVVAPAAVPTAPTAKPTREPKETLASFQKRLVAWDENRMAYERYVNDQKVKNMLGTNASGLSNRPLVQ